MNITTKVTSGFILYKYIFSNLNKNIDIIPSENTMSNFPFIELSLNLEAMNKNQYLEMITKCNQIS